MSATDPPKTVWDALEARDYCPHGQPHDFRARCPAHKGSNDESLHVSVGADGRALVHCFAHRCDEAAITSVLGLEVSDLFPAGHRNARRRELPHASRVDFTGPAVEAADLLCALNRLGERWRIEVTCDCPSCGSPHALLAISTDHGPWMSCPGGCTAQMAAQALAGRLADADGASR